MRPSLLFSWWGGFPEERGGHLRSFCSLIFLFVPWFFHHVIYLLLSSTTLSGYSGDMIGIKYLLPCIILKGVSHVLPAVILKWNWTSGGHSTQFCPVVSISCFNFSWISLNRFSILSYINIISEQSPLYFPRLFFFFWWGVLHVFQGCGIYLWIYNEHWQEVKFVVSFLCGFAVSLFSEVTCVWVLTLSSFILGVIVIAIVTVVVMSGAPTVRLKATYESITPNECNCTDSGIGALNVPTTPSSCAFFSQLFLSYDSIG